MMQGYEWGKFDLQASRECGLTLIELMVTIGIVAIILAIAIPEFGAWRQSFALQSADAALTAHIKQARLMAVSHDRTVNVVFSTNSYTVESYYLGATGSPVITYQRQYPLSEYSNQLTLAPNFPANSQLSGNPSTLTFYSSGMTNITANNNSVTISNANGTAKTISVNVVGQI